MGDKISLKVDDRQVYGKKVAKLREDGLVPAVIYGPGMDPVAVQVDQVVMSKVYTEAGKHAPVHLTVGGKKRIAMIKDVEVDAVKRRINHVSFHAVNINDPVVAEVPIVLVGEGESEAEKSGLIILQNLDSVEVRALPMDLPESIEVSILDLKEAGERVTLGDAKLPEGVEYVEHDDGRAEEEGEEAPSITDLQVASVWEPSALQAANEEDEDGPTDVSEVESEHGGDTDQGSQDSESQPGGKGQDEPKES